MITMPNCGNCHFNRNGSCHRFPPQISLWPTDNQHPVLYAAGDDFPSAIAGSWCGEWAPAPPAIPTEETIMINLGNRVKDTLTGFTGIAMARTEYLFGCAQIHVVPEYLKDGRPVEGAWIDEQRVTTVRELPIAVSPESSATSGGPQPTPPTREVPASY